MVNFTETQVSPVGHNEWRASNDLQQWFERSVARGKLATYAEPIFVTPEMARLFLSANHNNRTLKMPHVEQLASDLTEGRWVLNGESLTISSCGKLVNGQHRCHAIIVADKPMHTMVTWGVDFNARTTTDQGRTKRVGDYLSMDFDTANASVAAAAARLLVILKRARPTTKRWKTRGNDSLSKAVIYEEYAARKGEIDSAVSAVCSKRSSQFLGGDSLLACVLVLLRQKNEIAADAFMEKFLSGEDLVKGNPILAARERMIRDRNSLYASERITLLTNAFDAWVEGRAATKLIARRRGYLQ